MHDDDDYDCDDDDDDNGDAQSPRGDPDEGLAPWPDTRAKKNVDVSAVVQCTRSQSRICQSVTRRGLKSIRYPATMLPCYSATLPANSICYPATLLPSCCLAATLLPCYPDWLAGWLAN